MYQRKNLHGTHTHLYTAGLFTLTAFMLLVNQSKQIYQIAQATQQCWSESESQRRYVL